MTVDLTENDLENIIHALQLEKSDIGQLVRKLREVKASTEQLEQASRRYQELIKLVNKIDKYL